MYGLFRPTSKKDAKDTAVGTKAIKLVNGTTKTARANAAITSTPTATYVWLVIRHTTRGPDSFKTIEGVYLSRKGANEGVSRYLADKRAHKGNGPEKGKENQKVAGGMNGDRAERFLRYDVEMDSRGRLRAVAETRLGEFIVIEVVKRSVSSESCLTEEDEGKGDEKAGRQGEGDGYEADKDGWPKEDDPQDVDVDVLPWEADDEWDGEGTDEDE